MSTVRLTRPCSTTLRISRIAGAAGSKFRTRRCAQYDKVAQRWAPKQDKIVTISIRCFGKPPE